MKDRNKESRVGIFVTIGVMVVLASIVLFSGNSLLLASKYRLKMPMKDVQGLGVGSIVSLAGLHIGNVSRIEINPETNKMDVILTLDSRYQKQITSGSEASLKTQGALGDRYVYIEPHPSLGEPLLDGNYLHTSITPDLMEIISTRGAEFGNVLEIIKEVHTFIHNMNDRDRSAILMQNLAEASANMNLLMKESRATLKDIHDPALKESLQHFNNIMRKVDRGEGTLGELVNNPTLHDRLIAILGENPRNNYMKGLLRQSIQSQDKKSR